MGGGKQLSKRAFEEGSSSNPSQGPDAKKQKQVVDISSGSDSDSYLSEIGSPFHDDDCSLVLAISEVTMSTLRISYGQQWYLLYAILPDAINSTEFFCRSLLTQHFKHEPCKIRAGDDTGSVLIEFGETDIPAQSLHDITWDYHGCGVLIQRVAAVKKPEHDPADHEIVKVDSDYHHEPVVLELSILTMLALKKDFHHNQDNLVYVIMPDSPHNPELICRALVRQLSVKKATIKGGDVTGSVINKFPDASDADKLKNTTYLWYGYEFSFHVVSMIVRPAVDPKEYPIRRMTMP